MSVALPPATCRVPGRSPPGFSCTSYVSVPSPVPVAAPTILIHGTVETADHAQFEVVVILALPVPPVAANGALVDDSV